MAQKPIEAAAAQHAAGMTDAVLALAAAPNGQICFAAGVAGLYRSRDGGQNWRVAIQSERPLAALAVALSPLFMRDRTLFAGVADGVLRSRDGGATWGLATMASPPPTVVHLAFSPAFAKDRRVFAATEQDGVFRSTDGGDTWTTVVTPSGTADNPNGNNYGWGYEDNSGGGDRGAWINEQVDLSDYAGQTVLLRFEYVTDDALTRPGFMLDEVRIDAIGYQEGFETDDGGWDAQGWARVDNLLPQTYFVQLIEYGPEITVQRIPLDENQSAQIDLALGGDVRAAVLVVSGATPITTEVASYQFEVK